MADIKTQVSASINGLTREFDLIAHNLANVSTAGFKRRYNHFSKSLMAQEDALDKSSGKETKAHTAIDFSQGNFVQTGRTLDLALCGKGFFMIETPEGPLYTRNGMFRLNEDSQIVDLAGRIVAGESGPVTIPQAVHESQLSIADDGNIKADGVPLGKLKLVDFEDKETKLTPAGLNCFSAPVNIKPKEAENLIIKQGFQEGSNVQMMEELVDMIMVTRLYESNMKLLSKSGDTSKELLNVAMSG
jgi:flagellar basal-body rod protein FlgF